MIVNGGGCNVRYWHLADIALAIQNVRFRGRTDIPISDVRSRGNGLRPS